MAKGTYSGKEGDKGKGELYKERCTSKKTLQSSNREHCKRGKKEKRKGNKYLTLTPEFMQKGERDAKSAEQTKR